LYLSCGGKLLLIAIIGHIARAGVLKIATPSIPTVNPK
jgi:hypothetical protein